MILLSATQNKLITKNREMITSGTVNVNQCHFDFSSDWDGLSRTAAFHCAGKTVNIVLDDTNTCYIPWEVMEYPARELKVGVEGTNGNDVVVLPTIWASLGTVLEGTKLGDDAREPTPDVYQQILGQMGDLSSLTTEDKSSLVAAINEVRATGGGGSGFEIDETLRFQNGILGVNTADSPEEDNTLPITSAAVASSIGNIEEILKTI